MRYIVGRVGRSPRKRPVTKEDVDGLASVETQGEQRTQSANSHLNRDSGGSRYVKVGGGRHLADAPYVLPHDDQEINRLDFQHYMLRYALRGNLESPLVGSPASILDVGSGYRALGNGDGHLLVRYQCRRD